jgi:outer membrane protein assembly factor BamB
MKHSLPLLLAVLFGWTATAPAADWSFWRGPEQNGVSRERDLPDTFSLNAKAKDNNLIWRSPYGGITTPIVQNGRVYFITKVGEDVTQQERVLCLDADTGRLLWEHRFNVFMTDIVRDRLGWTQMVGDPQTGNVYAHGTQGFLICFDKDGKILWQHSLTEEYGRVSGYGGRITSPIVDGDLLIMCLVNASWGEQTIGGTRLAAFDKRTGAVVWWASTGYRVKDTHNCVPIVAVIGGQRLVITGGGDGGVHAFKVRTGEKVWSYIFGDGAVNCSAVVEGDRVYIGHGENNPDSAEQGRVICLDGSKVEKGKPKLIWQVDGIKVKFASPILHEGKLYVCNESAQLFCLDAKSGKELWTQQYGSNTKGSPLWADGKIYVAEVDSRFHILKPKEDGCDDLCSVFFRGRGVAPVKLSGSPAVVNGRIYFMTTAETVCIGKKGHKAPADAIPPKPAEAAVAADAAPAHLQVVPADVSLTPGQSAAFKVLAYDAHGRSLGEVKADWSLAGPLPPVFPIGMPAPPPPKTPPAAPPALKGVLEPATGTGAKLTVGAAPPSQFGRVVAKSGGLTAYARVRVAPLLPYSIDFAKVREGGIPGGWVNCQGKFAVAKLRDGTAVLKKRNDNASPLVAEAHAFIGMPELTDYTIEADVMGSKARSDMPDMGVDANRYTLVLVGNTQQLRLISWDALPRINQTIAFPWKPDVWYHLKLTVTVHGDKAVARGKVWPRGEAEPKEWTVTVEDPCPNREGSPGLYGQATGVGGPTSPGSAGYFANVKITPNK